MKIFFVNRYFYPDLSATSQILTDLVGALGDVEQQVVVVTSRCCYNDPSCYLIDRDSYAGADVVRLNGTAFSRGSLLGRFLEYLSFYWGAFWYLNAALEKGDVVIAKTDPPMLGVFLSGAIRWRNAKLINWYQDLFPEVAEGVGFRFPRIGYRTLKFMRDVNARRATGNVVIGRRMYEYMKARNIAPSLLRSIPNWALVTSSEVDPVREIQLRQNWELAQKLVVGYSGNMGRVHDWRTILECAVRLRDQADIVFLVIGGGVGVQLLQSAVREYCLENVVFKAYQSRESLGASLSVIDLHLVTLLPSAAEFVVPSKVYGILAVGRPFIYIGPSESEVADIAIEGGAGIQIDVGDVDSLVNHILSLAGDRERLRAMGKAAMLQHDNRYAREFAVKSWVKVLEEQGLSSNSKCS